MSDAWGEHEAVAAAPITEGPTAGALLRQAREAAGLHVAALAVALKVPVRKLEALEEDRYDLMPDNVFVRGLASSVCRTLKIDPQPIMERLPQRAAPRLVRTDDGINTPFRAPSDAAPPTWYAQLTRPVFLAVFALLFAALVLILLPVGRSDTFSRAGGSTAALPTVMPSEPAASASAMTEPVFAPAPSSAGSAGAAAAVSSAPPVALTLAPSASVAVPPLPVANSIGFAPAAPVDAAASAVAPGAAPANSTVVFRAKGPSWVEVTDARGVVALRKVLASGESAGASGTMPLRVTVGRTDVTEVEVRGKPFDLSPHLKSDSVARFEVK